ncbi:hypothetical protein JOC77_000427 [Peribacillus deserti]|uniref:Uncharacterized protein n=1 Tax=Peribacillus deserti TaxID=673318 RepID=A0ABS2QEA8_9BACI|nr:hypothetical protein [Peribacillus deserti]MBM7691024.1 hypothetical protein [Peribacillus deserti]
MKGKKIWIGEITERSIDGELLQVVVIWPDDMKKEAALNYQELKYKWI